MQVLLIEPDRMQADAMSQLLIGAGCAVHLVVSAQDAIATLDDHAEISAIVCDVQIGEHSAIEVLHELRSYDDWLNVGVLLLSSYSAETLPIPQEQLARYKPITFLYMNDLSVNRLQSALASVAGKRAMRAKAGGNGE